MMGEKSFQVYISPGSFIFLSFFRCIIQIDLEVLPVTGLQILSLCRSLSGTYSQPQPPPDSGLIYSYVYISIWMYNGKLKPSTLKTKFLANSLSHQSSASLCQVAASSTPVDKPRTENSPMTSSLSLTCCFKQCLCLTDMRTIDLRSIEYLRT